MKGESHDLIHEFPEYVEQIQNLKTVDESFNRLFEEYHHINTQVQRVEYDIEPASDAYAETLKKKRLALKDELFHRLKEVA